MYPTKPLNVTTGWLAILLFVSPVLAVGATEFAGGSGIIDDPYQIATREHLESIGDDPNLLDKHFVLTADIDLNPQCPGGRIYHRSLIAPRAIVIVPCEPKKDRGTRRSFVTRTTDEEICTHSIGEPFSGSFDGQGYSIHHLTMYFDESNPSTLGLFGTTRATSLIQNLMLKNISAVNCSNSPAEGPLGGLVSHNAGSIRNCYVSGWVAGTAGIGGLAGANGGRIEMCHTSAAVAGFGQIGGLVGINTGSLYACYVSGVVLGRLDAHAVGGLVGTSSIARDGTIKHCYVSSHVVPGAETKEELRSIGGLIGTGEAEITSSYYLAPNICKEPLNDTGQPLPDAALRQQTSFVGWDFVGETANGTADLWIMEEGAYPRLWWEKE